MAKSRRINPNIKYYPPRLCRKLELAQTYPFTLIEAPSGFGKTTLLEHFFAEQLPASVPRYIYDFESDEPLYIWKQICQRIAGIDPVCGARLQKCGPPDEDNLTELHETLQALTCPHECYLWLDNYRRWDNPFSGEFLDQLARHKGKGLHIIVSTQPLPPAVRRRAGLTAGCWQMRDEDLAFRTGEIEAYFSAAGLPLSHEQALRVSRLTEGWIMALSLQLLCFLERGDFEQGGMTALMEHTFWDRLSEQEEEFLLHISIFPRFTLRQAALLSGRSSSETDHILREKRYFIHFDGESRCFYPHAQLRILLREHFACLPPETRKAIYLQGGILAEQEHDRLNTLRFYYAADAWERILDMPLSSYELADVMRADVQPIILDILDRTPPEIKRRHPQTILSMAFCLFILGKTRKLMELRGEILKTIRSSALPERERNALEGEYELLVSFLEYNRIGRMSRRHQRALELLGGPARLISPKSIWTFGSPSILYLYWRESGKLDEELDEMDACMPIYYALTNSHGAGAELVMRAEAHLLRGRPEEALPLCCQALFVAEQNRQDSIIQCCFFTMCRVAFQQEDMQRAEELLAAMRTLSARHREDLGRYTYDVAAGFMALLKGRPQEVAPWLAGGEITDKRLVTMVQPLAHIVYERCMLLRRQYRELLGVSRYVMGLSSVFPNLLAQVYTHICCAAALKALEKREEAVRELQMAADLAFPDRIYLPFAELYREIRFLLPSILMHSEDRQSIEALAPVFCTGGQPEREPFTPREQEILLLLKERLTNKEIAKRIGISPNTVRNTISAMLKKCGFRTRVQLQELE